MRCEIKNFKGLKGRDAKNIYVVLEYCEYGNLYQKLRKEKCFSEETARHIIA